MSGSAAWTNTSPLTGALAGVAATDTQILLIRREIMSRLLSQSGSCARCCPGRGAATAPFLRRENTLKALQLHNQKETKNQTKPKPKPTPRTDWRKRLKLTKGERTKEGMGGGGWIGTCRPPSDVLPSLLSLTCTFFLFPPFSEWVSAFFPPSSEGCIREIVHHIPHIL